MMSMHAGVTGSTSGTVFNVAGTRIVVSPSRPSGSGAVLQSTSTVLRTGSESEVRLLMS